MKGGGFNEANVHQSPKQRIYVESLFISAHEADDVSVSISVRLIRRPFLLHQTAVAADRLLRDTGESQ